MNGIFSLSAHFEALPAVTTQNSFLTDHPPSTPQVTSSQSDSRKPSRLFFNSQAPNPGCSRHIECGGQKASWGLAMQVQQDNGGKQTDTDKLMKEQGMDADSIQWIASTLHRPPRPWQSFHFNK